MLYHRFLLSLENQLKSSQFDTCHFAFLPSGKSTVKNNGGEAYLLYWGHIKSPTMTLKIWKQNNPLKDIFASHLNMEYLKQQLQTWRRDWPDVTFSHTTQCEFWLWSACVCACAYVFVCLVLVRYWLPKYLSLYEQSEDNFGMLRIFAGPQNFKRVWKLEHG